MLPLTTPQQELLDWITTYIQQCQKSPSLREMMQGLGLRSVSAVQARLGQLRQKGYVDWIRGKIRTIRVLPPAKNSMPLLGTIAASGLITTFTDTVESFDTLTHLPPRCFALRVSERLEPLLLQVGDLLLLKPVSAPQSLKDGAIVAVRQKEKTTLNRLERKGDLIRLLAIGVDEPGPYRFQKHVAIQGVMVGVWRGCL